MHEITAEKLTNQNLFISYLTVRVTPFGVCKELQGEGNKTHVIDL